MSALDLHAERFAPSGAMAADGIRKLLGAPALTLVQTVIREAVQNSWDARVLDEQVEFQIALRHLNPEEKRAMADNVFAELPANRESAQPIRKFLRGRDCLVMELSDWGTRGLGGPTRADVIPARGEPTDFVNFIRNLGMRRDTAQGGGTYGYGKTSLYSMSSCATVLVDSLTSGSQSRPVRRFIGCHLGEAHDVGRTGRLTGRHWWGRKAAREEFVEPLTGRQASALAGRIGMPKRDDEDTGTTLMILDPDFGDRSLEDVAGEIQETLLWFLWPKMLAGPDGPDIKFRLFLEAEELELPEPDAFPPLDLLIEAYRALKGRSAHDVSEIWSERPVRLLGHCAIRRGFRSPRRQLTDPEYSIIPHAASHIALMRPVELVVKYIEGTALPSDGHEWAGVFICSDDREVEQAFADAEPPAHDDWIPDKMPKGWPKTFVRVALSRLRQLASAYAYPDLDVEGEGSSQPSLARAADRLGELIPFGAEVADGPPGRPGAGGGGKRGGGGTGDRKHWQVSEPRFLRLREGTEGSEALFEIDIANRAAPLLKVTAVPVVVIDGTLGSEEDSGGIEMPLFGWEDGEGTLSEPGPTLSVASGTQATYRVRIGVPADTAVGVRIRVSDGGTA